MKKLTLIICLSVLAVYAFAQTLQPLYTLQRTTDAFTDANMAFSPDGKNLAYGTLDGKINIFDLINGKEAHSINTGENFIICVAYNSDGTLLASGDKNGVIRVYETKTFELKYSIEAHKKAILDVAFSPDKEILFSGSRDNLVRTFNANTGAALLTFEKAKNNIRTLTFSPDGKYIICATSSLMKGIVYFDMNTGKFVKELKSPNTESIAISPDEQFIASANLSSKVVLRNLLDSAEHELFGHVKYVFDVEYSPGGKILISAGEDKTVKVWNATKKILISSFDAHSESIKELAYSPKGNMIASSSWDKTIKVWDISGLNLPDETIYVEADNSIFTTAEQEIINTTYNNLEFEVNQAVIRSSSFPSLDNLAEMLKKKPAYKLTLSGHTDNTGDATKNFKLSIQRAEAVKIYLVSKGVETARITANGYGATKPIASNLTDEGKQKNRRVEIQIVAR